MSPLKAFILTAVFTGIYALAAETPMHLDAAALLYFILLSGRDWATWRSSGEVPDNPNPVPAPPRKGSNPPSPKGAKPRPPPTPPPPRDVRGRRQP